MLYVENVLLLHTTSTEQTAVSSRGLHTYLTHRPITYCDYRTYRINCFNIICFIDVSKNVLS